MPRKNNTLRITGKAHIAFNVIPKENESSFFYDGTDVDLAMMLAIVADCDKRFARILKIANNISIEYVEPSKTK